MAHEFDPSAIPAPDAARIPWPFPLAEEQFSTALDALPDPVFVLTARRDANRDVTEFDHRIVNTAALRLFGRRREELVGHGQLELFPAVRGSQLWATYVAVLESGQRARVESPTFDDSGVGMTVALSVGRFDDALIVTAHDLTDRLRIEEQLRHEHDLVNAVLDVAGALIVVVDADYRIVRFNRQSELLTGYRERDVVGRNFEFLVPPSERIGAADEVEPRSGKHPVNQLNHWVTKHGDSRLIRWSNSALFDADGRMTHLIKTGIDITEQHRGELELVRRAAELETANRELARSGAELTQSEDTIVELHLQADDRQQIAREVNDTIVQGLVAAEMSYDLGEQERARDLLRTASRAARDWVGRLLIESGRLHTGGARLREAADHRTGRSQ